MNAQQSPKTTAFIWLIARLYLGSTWFGSGFEKVFGDGNAAWIGADAGKVVTGVLKGAIAKSALAPGFDPAKTPHPPVAEWYATLARDVFLPNAQLFSYMVAFGELLVGIALIVGLFTRFSAVMAAVMALAFLLAGSTSGGLPILLTVGLAVAMAGSTVGYYGLDTFARPIELKLARRAHLNPAAQAA